MDEHDALDEKSTDEKTDRFPSPINREELTNAQATDGFCQSVWEEKSARGLPAHENTDGIFVRKNPTDPWRHQIIVL